MAQDKRYIRFTGRLWADMSFEPQLGWETEQIASLPHIDDDEYQIDLREDDQQLVTVTPRIDPFIPCSPGERTSVTPAQVVGYIPLHPDANRLVFRRDGRILYDTELASAPPDVEFESVEREDEDAIVLSWHAEHETGAHAELTYDIAYVADGEQAMLVAHSLADTEHSVPLASLPGSERGQFAVLATDGLRSSVALSDPISVDVKPPRVWIQQPDPKTSYPADQPISLIGQAVDIGGERLPEEPLRWSVDGTTVAEGSYTALVTELRPGEQEIQLAYLPDDGMEGTDSITITIVERSEEQERYAEMIGHFD